MTIRSDPNGQPMTIGFNGSEHFFLYNAQGDVVAIANYSGEIVVEYTYDAWGNPLSCTGSLADTLGKKNPFRYRGYVYDEETGLYYLKSRYYDPRVGRFICMDGQLIISESMLGTNLYAYCFNRCNYFVDSSGQRPIKRLPPAVHPLRNNKPYIGYGDWYYNDPSDTSNPGDLFNSAEEAAHAAAEKYNSKSIQYNLEYACAIYMVNYLQLYPHCDPALFPGFELPIRYSYSYPNIGVLNEVTFPRYPGQVAAIHTHGAESSFLLFGTLGSKVFSPKDKEVAQRIGVPLYLANPYGEFRVYYPNLDEDYVLPYSVPIDPAVQN